MLSKKSSYVQHFLIQQQKLQIKKTHFHSKNRTYPWSNFAPISAQKPSQVIHNPRIKNQTNCHLFPVSHLLLSPFQSQNTLVLTNHLMTRLFSILGLTPTSI